MGSSQHLDEVIDGKCWSSTRRRAGVWDTVAVSVCSTLKSVSTPNDEVGECDTCCIYLYDQGSVSIRLSGLYWDQSRRDRE